MPRIDEPLDEYRHGSLVVEELSAHCVDVFYIPSRQKLEQSGMNPDKDTKPRIKLLQIDGWNQRLKIFPVNTLGGHANFMQPKYDKIKCITLGHGKLTVFNIGSGGSSDQDGVFRSPYFGPTVPLEEGLVDTDSLKVVPSTQEDVMDVLEGLPPAFTKDYEYGLGLAKPYRFIVNAVEELSDCTEIMLTEEHETGIDQREKVFYISVNDFETARKCLNSTTNISRIAAQSVKEGAVYNLLAERIGKSTVPVSVGRHPLRKLFTSVAQGEKPLSDDDQLVVLKLLEKNIESIAETKQEKLVRLQNDIELVNLERLIARYEEMITKDLNEGEWQQFFNENPIILSLAFGYPIIKVQDRALVGGRKFSGSGEKITDFLVKNSMINSAAIIEIKTPQKKLLNEKPFRDAVYTPSSELSGSINQALDQKHMFEREIAVIKENSGIYDLKSYSVHCCLIIGTIPSDEDRQKSFELFRRNSKNVEIVTFDELLKKLTDLLGFLNSP